MLINIRFYLYHFQVYKNLKIRIEKNEYHRKRAGHNTPNFEVYTFFKYSKY